MAEAAVAAGRVIFISATHLSKNYSEIPVEIMEPAIFFFGSKRSWVFPRTPQEQLESSRQPTNYLGMEQGFKALILDKEKQGLVYWLKPEQDFAKVSKFLEGIVDPVTDEKYKPLILDDAWWKTRLSFTFRTNRMGVIANYKMGEHDYEPTMELLVASNPTLRPVLKWQ